MSTSSWSLLVSSFVAFIGLASVSGSGTNIRICKPNRIIELSTASCYGGIFLDSKELLGKDSETNCICTRGLWYIQSNLCATDHKNQELSHAHGGQFILSNYGCFDPDNFKLGKSSSVFMQHLGTFTKLEHSGLPFVLSSLSNGILLDIKKSSTKPSPGENLYTVNLGSTCNHIHKASNLITLRFLNSNDSDTSWSVTKNDDSLSLCLLSRPGIEDALYFYNVSELCVADSNDVLLDFNEGFGFGLEKIQSILNFREGCEYEDGNEWLDVLPESLHHAVIPESDSAMCQKCFRSLGNLSMNHGIDDEEYGCIPDDVYDRSELDYAIDLQSARIGLYLQNRLLKPEQYDDDYIEEISEMELLRKASILAFGACNSTMIPKEFYQYFLIMFKALLMESTTNYPPQKFLASKSLKYIRHAIDKCLARTTVYKINLASETGICPSLEMFGSSMQNKEDLEVVIAVPEGFQSNPEVHDYLLEFTWKLSTFLFYHCYQDFESGPTQHYELRQQIESIFTEDLLIRWANPSNSLEMYKELFKTYLNLETTMKNFDQCVGASHALSKYAPDVWLKRPLDRPSNGMNAFKKPNFCRDNLPNWYSEDPNEIVTISRVKLDPNPGENNLNGTIKCVSNLKEYLLANKIGLQDCF